MRTDSTIAPGTEPTNRFDPLAAVVGDSVLGLRIGSMDVQPSNGETKGWEGFVQFQGDRILSGVYRRHPYDPDLDELCFFPDDMSARQLPIFPNDERTSWFCFTNQEEARTWLGHPSDGQMETIEVDRYRYYYSHSDVYNTARLLRVVSHKDSLAGHEWVLHSQGGEPVLPGTRITLSVSPQHLGGYAGCNWFGGEYEVSGDTLKITDVSMTARLCERPGEVMDQENAYVGVLDSELLYRIIGDTLLLENDSGDVVLLFHRRRRHAMDPADLVDRHWSLQRFTSRPLIAGTQITLIFNEDRIRGFAGCRNYTGTYRAERDDISFPRLAMTETDCPDERLRVQEGDFTTALSETNHYLLGPGRLELFTVGGDTLVFETLR